MFAYSTSARAGELRSRLTSLGESTSTPGATGEERRAVLMRRLIDAICGQESGELLDVADDNDDEHGAKRTGAAGTTRSAAAVTCATAASATAAAASAVVAVVAAATVAVVAVVAIVAIVAGVSNVSAIIDAAVFDDYANSTVNASLVRHSTPLSLPNIE